MLDTILTALKAERDKLTKAIAALEGTATAAPASPTVAPATAIGRRRRRWKMSAEARQQISEAKKKWWAKRKRKAK
jgi:hypothetical protein